MNFCQTHPEREASARCHICGAPLCEECCAPGFDETTCFDCSIERTGNNIALEEESRGAASGTDTPKPSPVFSRGVIAFMAVSLLVVAVETFFILSAPGTESAPGDLPSPTPKAQLAVAQTGADAILLKIQVEAYQQKHGVYPPDLSTVLESLPPEIRSELRARNPKYEKNGKKGFSLELSSPDGKKMKISDEGTPILFGRAK